MLVNLRRYPHVFDVDPDLTGYLDSLVNLDKYVSKVTAKSNPRPSGPKTDLDQQLVRLLATEIEKYMGTLIRGPRSYKKDRKIGIVIETAKVANPKIGLSTIRSALEAHVGSRGGIR